MARRPKAPLAAWIVEQRKAKALKPADLAARLGVAETTIRGWETGRGVSAENVASLERLFGVAAPDAPPPADMAALVAAMTNLVDELRADRQSRPTILREAPASYDIDATTLRRRRAYWIDRALDEGKLNAESIAKKMNWPTSQLGAVRRWLKGDIPDGATRTAFAQALMLPLSVLESPPATDHERLVEWRREALEELPAVETKRPAQQRRSA